MTLKVKCLQCGTELFSSPRTLVCGCSNQTELYDDRVSAKDLSLVQITEVNEDLETDRRSVINALNATRDWQTARSQRKIRHQTFEER